MTQQMNAQQLSLVAVFYALDTSVGCVGFASIRRSRRSLRLVPHARRDAQVMEVNPEMCRLRRNGKTDLNCNFEMQAQHYFEPCSTTGIEMKNHENALVTGTQTARDMQQWLTANCDLDDRATTRFSELHGDWLTWSAANDCFASSARCLSLALGHLGWQRCVVSSGNARAYRGISLKIGGAA